MQRNNFLSPQRKYIIGDMDPRMSLLFRTPRTRASWRKQDQDELLGLYEDHSHASGSSVPLPSKVCPLCCGQETTEEDRCTECSIKMMDPHGWGHALFMLDEASSSTQAGLLLPAFGEVRTEHRASQSELDSRGSSPEDLHPHNSNRTNDGDEASQRGETVAPTTDGGDEDGRDGEIDTGDEDADGETDPDFNGEPYWDAAGPSPYLAASIPLPEEDEGENEEFTNGDSKPEDDFTATDEHEDGEEVDAEKNEAEENEGEDEADDRNEEPADYDYENGSKTSVPSVRMSSFSHPDAPKHKWIAEDIALAMIVRRQDENGKVTQAASTEEMMAIFPESQRVVMVNGRYRCMALARVNRTTREWEEYDCGSQSYKRRNDFRRHFTDKHLADQRPEQRCRGEGKGKGSGGAQRKRKRQIADDEEEEEEEDDDNNADPQSDFVPPANKRARRQ